MVKANSKDSGTLLKVLTWMDADKLVNSNGGIILSIIISIMVNLTTMVFLLEKVS